MRGRPHKHGGLILSLEQAIEFLHIIPGLDEAASLEEVEFLPQHNGGLGCSQQHQVGQFQAGGQDTQRVLFGVSGQLVFQVAQPGGQVAARRRHAQSPVCGPEPMAQRAAAGVARDAHLPPIDFRPLQQYAKRHLSVMQAPAGKIVAAEFELPSHMIVRAAKPRKILLRLILH